MPVFLQEYVTAEFDAAFAEKGLTRNDRMNDLQILLHYDHINLSSEQESIDPFVRVEAMNVELNYVAAIDIEIRETATDDIVWAGTISRIHQVVPGEYMHEDRARPAFREAFRALLSSYPPLNANPSSTKQGERAWLMKATTNPSQSFPKQPAICFAPSRP